MNSQADVGSRLFKTGKTLSYALVIASILALVLGALVLVTMPMLERRALRAHLQNDIDLEAVTLACAQVLAQNSTNIPDALTNLGVAHMTLNSSNEVMITLLDTSVCLIGIRSADNTSHVELFMSDLNHTNRKDLLFVVEAD